MVTRILLTRPKGEVSTSALLDILLRLQSLRQKWPGIVTLTIGETTIADHPYCVVLEYVTPALMVSVVHTQDYQAIYHDLETLCSSLLSFDIISAASSHELEISPPLTYGFFQLTVEERLKHLFRLWFQGTGQQITGETALADLIDQEDITEINWIEFDFAVEEEFGISDILTSYDFSKATFSQLASLVEQKLDKQKHLK